MKPWTMTEIQVLKMFAPMGTAAVAELLERSQASVAKKAAELNVSLRTRGEDIDINVLPSRLLVWVRETPRLRLCPMCGCRLASMKTTGLCRVCHLDRLIDLRREELDVIVREKRLTKLRQDKKRMRICSSCGIDFYPRASSTDELCGGCSD